MALTPVMSAATAYRAWIGYANVWYKQAPQLTSLWLDAVEPGAHAEAAGGEFREEVLALTQKSVDAAYREVKRGIHDLQEFSQPPKARSTPAAAVRSARTPSPEAGLASPEPRDRE